MGVFFFIYQTSLSLPPKNILTDIIGLKLKYYEEQKAGEQYDKI